MKYGQQRVNMKYGQQRVKNPSSQRINELERQLQFDRAEAEEVKVKLDQQRKVVCWYGLIT